MGQFAVRKVGNSLGVIFPEGLVKRLGLVPWQALVACLEDGKLNLSLPTKPRYSLSDLVAQCDSSAKMPTDLRAWEAAPAIGHELP